MTTSRQKNNPFSGSPAVTFVSRQTKFAGPLKRRWKKRCRGASFTVANRSGQWPGLVGMLNLNGSLIKAGVAYSTLWSEDFRDTFFVNKLRQWLKTGRVTHSLCSLIPLAY